MSTCPLPTDRVMGVRSARWADETMWHGRLRRAPRAGGGERRLAEGVAAVDVSTRIEEESRDSLVVHPRRCVERGRAPLGLKPEQCIQGLRADREQPPHFLFVAVVGRRVQFSRRRLRRDGWRRGGAREGSAGGAALDEETAGRFSIQ